MDSTKFYKTESSTVSQMKGNNRLLIYAIAGNDKKRLKELLKNTSVEKLKSLLIKNFTPINYCISLGFLSLIPALVNAGVDIDTNVHDDEIHEGLVNPVIYAALHGSIQALKLLVKLGARIDFNDKKIQDTFIHLAKNKAKKQLSIFLNYSSNITINLIELLVNNSKDDSLIFDEYIQEVIDCFIKKHDIEAIKFILTQYEYTLELDIVTGSSLFTASESGADEILSFLIKNYANFLDSYHYEDALNIAVMHNLNACVSILLEKCDLISFDTKFESLVQAVQLGHVETLNALLEYEDFEILVEENTKQLYSILQSKIASEEFNLLVFQLEKIKSFKVYYDEMKTRIDSLYNTFSPNLMLQGPLIKDLFTYELEWIAKYTLRNPKECVYSIKKNNLYVNIKKHNINLSKLIKNAELGHLAFSEEDSFAFSTQKLLSQDIIDFLKEPLPVNYLLSEKTLTDAEKLAINYYSDEGHTVINSILHGNPNEEKIDEHSNILDAFLHIIFLASGLSKIMPSWTRDPESLDTPLKSFRGEEHTTHEELKQRTKKLSNNIDGIIQSQSGFTSTSSEQDVASEFTKKLSRIEYAELYGKNIQPLSVYKQEKEYLQLPSFVHFEQVALHEEINVFQAKVVAPLYKKYRSTQQEYRLKHLSNITNSTNLLPSFIFDQTQPILLEGLLKECQHAYKHYLSLAFTENWMDIDWELKTQYGIIPRPNHGLAHTMRVAHLIPTVAQALVHYNNRFNFSDREICIMQVSAIFSVVGRKNEAGFRDNETRYKAFKETSAQAFSAYVKKHQFLNMTENEIKLYSAFIFKSGEPGEDAPAAILLAIARKLDLLRCFDVEKIQNDIIPSLNQHLPSSCVEQLINYAEALLHATGNRVLYGTTPIDDYNHEIFYQASTNVKFCYEALAEITPPIFETLILPFAKNKPS